MQWRELTATAILIYIVAATLLGKSKAHCYVKRDVYTSSIFEMVQCGVGLATLRAVT